MHGRCAIGIGTVIKHRRQEGAVLRPLAHRREFAILTEDLPCLAGNA